MIGAARALLVAVALAIAVWPPVAKAQPPERILDYRVQVYVLANGNLDVVERIDHLRTTPAATSSSKFSVY